MSMQKTISITSDTFALLQEQFDRILNRTIGNMEMKGASDAVMTLKLTISLSKESRDTGDGTRDFTIPKFKHDINSVMQVKDRVSGELAGDYELVWDVDENKYVMRKIDNGQIDILDEDTVGADCEVADDHALPEHVEDEDSEEDPDDGGDDGDTPDEQDDEPDDDDDSESYELDPTTPFGWLAQFIGKEMRVLGNNDTYTLRTVDGNKVILSNKTAPTSPFFCEELSEHLGAYVDCNGYGDKKLVVICLQFKEGGDVLFTMTAPGATDEEVEEAMNFNYDYDPPEE